ncbi:hypothetical protein VINI7043_24042 [Vibrio nigripulchritudo ATCC 27043]|nr:hypothetical protein VINI7043_24042 [Vibrio nigripulchritudo ATCC 27043]
MVHQRGVDGGDAAGSESLKILSVPVAVLQAVNHYPFLIHTVVSY